MRVAKVETYISVEDDIVKLDTYRDMSCGWVNDDVWVQYRCGFTPEGRPMFHSGWTTRDYLVNNICHGWLA
jgi:hypothetical protein